MGPVDLDETSREKLLVSDSFFPHSTEFNLYFLCLILIFFIVTYSRVKQITCIFISQPDLIDLCTKLCFRLFMYKT